MSPKKSRIGQRCKKPNMKLSDWPRRLKRSRKMLMNLHLVQLAGRPRKDVNDQNHQRKLEVGISDVAGIPTWEERKRFCQWLINERVTPGQYWAYARWHW